MQQQAVPQALGLVGEGAQESLTVGRDGGRQGPHHEALGLGVHARGTRGERRGEGGQPRAEGAVVLLGEAERVGQAVAGSFDGRAEVGTRLLRDQVPQGVQVVLQDPARPPTRRRACTPSSFKAPPPSVNARPRRDPRWPSPAVPTPANHPCSTV